ncbi:transposase [Nocardia otitidiscaviarum]|uniref:pPIWI_RE_Z domain-containing protein n=1 Tax=Nocardia otitidiscaviarum TaxID=1823 RepID=UPI001893B711|nr:transposase [Nocardia otitidiscaviarum]MBF6238720.1 transposase [Nocardia otitidiscaviarum]
MRDSQRWKTDAIKAVQRASDPPMHRREAARLLDVELCIFLAQQVAPTSPCTDAWALLGGYPFVHATGQSVDEDTEHVIAVARHLLLRYKDFHDWQSALRWYSALDETLRGYELDLDTGAIRQRQPRMLTDRWQLFDLALSAPPPHSTTSASPGGHGHYLVNTVQGPTSVTIPEWIPLGSPTAGHDLTIRQRDPITVSWAELQAAAEHGDRLEEQKGWSPRSNWASRLSDVRLEVRAADHSFHPSQTLTIDGMLHLIGMVGAGKSTLVEVLVLWASLSKPSKRICVVLDNVTAVLRKVTHLRALGIAAAPVLGQSNRLLHLRRLHRLTAPSDGTIGPTNEPMFDLISTACGLDGLRDHSAQPWDVRRPPCRSLEALDAQDDAEHRGCPLWHGCARHAPSRDLVDATVWVATPASLIHTPVPTELNGEKMRYLEPAWRRSDLIVVDEADQVQAQLDAVFSPSQQLIGEGFEAWLDEIDRLTKEWIRRDQRQRMHDPRVRLWATTLTTAMTAVHMMYGLLSTDQNRTPKALDRRWLDTGYFTEWTLSQQLAQSWAGYGPRGRGNQPIQGWESDPAYIRLRQAFDTFIDDPLAGDPPPDEVAIEMVALTKSILNDSHETDRQRRVEEWLRTLRKNWPASNGTLPGIDDVELERQATRLQFGIYVAVLATRLNRLVEMFRDVEFELGLEGNGSSLFHRAPREFQSVVPESPMGNVLGFQYVEEDDAPNRRGGPMGQLRFFRCTGIGRWLLSHLHELYQADGKHGPNVVMLSATSWAGTSPRYHIDVPVDAVLKPPDRELAAIRHSHFEFLPLFAGSSTEPIRISGTRGERREAALQRMVAALADPGAGKSLLEQRRDLLPPNRRRILLLVGSYLEAKLVADHLVRLRSSWRDQICRLIPDDEEFTASWDGPRALRRGDVSTFADTGAWLLVAPLLAVERGHNILNDEDKAAIGAAYFLIRPHPRPDDLHYIIQRVNQWACLQIANGLPAVRNPRGEIGEIAREFRRAAHRRWRALLHMKLAYSTLRTAEQQALAWTMLVTIWQVIGRLVRGGEPAQVFFCDAAFAPAVAQRSDTARDDDSTSLLIGLRDILAPYFRPDCTDADRDLVDALYGCLYTALSTIEGL